MLGTVTDAKIKAVAQAVREKTGTSAAIRLSDMPALIRSIGYPAYTGSYNVTPSTQQQTLHVEGRVMSQDVTINAVPSNYGKISWDGSTLTVE